MSTRTANRTKSTTAATKSAPTVRTRGQKGKAASKPAAAKKSTEKTQKTMTLRFDPDPKSAETKGTFRYAEQGEENAIGTLYLRKAAAAALGITSPDAKLKVTIEVVS